MNKETKPEKGILTAFGQRWNKRTKAEVAFAPEDEELVPGVIPTELPAVDSILGGGIPRGRTSVFIGEPAAGKTLLSQLVIAAAQRQGGKAIFFDAEHTYDPKWFAMTGVDTSPERLLIMRPESLEQTFDMIEDALKNVRPDVLVVDSIPSLIPQAILDAKMEEKDFQGLAARKVTEGVKKMTQYNHSTALIYINQIRTDMGVRYGNPESMPGGKGLRHWSSLTVRVRRGKFITAASDGLGEAAFDDVSTKKDAPKIGFWLRIRTEKNKLAVGYQETDVKFFFDGTVDPVGSLIHLAIQRGVIVAVAGGYYEVPGVKKKLHGLGAVEELLKANAGLKDKIVAEIEEA